MRPAVGAATGPPEGPALEGRPSLAQGVNPGTASQGEDPALEGRPSLAQGVNPGTASQAEALALKGRQIGDGCSLPGWARPSRRTPRRPPAPSGPAKSET